MVLDLLDMDMVGLTQQDRFKTKKEQFLFLSYFFM